MFDEITISLTKQISIEGLTDETINKIISLTDTLLSINNYDDINITNIQTLLLLLQDFEIDPKAKRLVEELRYKIIRISINQFENDIAAQYTTSVMNRDFIEKIYEVSVLQNGKIKLDVQFSEQPLIPADELLLNDFGHAALHKKNNQEDIVLAVEKFEIPRVGCCGMIRTDMLYPIGKTCEEDSFIDEAIALCNSYGTGSDTRTADTYAIEYFIGKPGQNFREAGKSLYSFELKKDNLWHYSKNSIELFVGDKSAWANWRA